MPNDWEILKSPFDFETHKNHFINYLEVVIDLDGTIMYATPSHQEKLIRLACERHDVSRDKLNDMCPQEYYFDFMTWLMLMTGVIPVWTNGYMGTPTDDQAESLRKLAIHGLYTGGGAGMTLPPELLEIKAVDREAGLYRLEDIREAGYVKTDSRKAELVNQDLSGTMTTWLHPERAVKLLFLKKRQNYYFAGIARKKS